MHDHFDNQLTAHLALFERLTELAPATSCASQKIAESLRAGNKLMLCGNGGSAADSQHIAAEFTGRFVHDRIPLAAMALSTDTSAITCIANDYSFDDVFERQVRGLGRPGDCLIAISTSGNSRNVLRAVEAARRIGIVTIGLLGRDGGQVGAACDLPLVVPSAVTARIQEAHIFIGHLICAQVEDLLGVAGGPNQPVEAAA